VGPLLRGDRQAEVTVQHCRVAAMVGRVGRRPSEDLAKSDRDMMGMVRVVVREDWT
jgi:hypothetical protein